jgi:hypothetical protein
MRERHRCVSVEPWSVVVVFFGAGGCTYYETLRGKYISKGLEGGPNQHIDVTQVYFLTVLT